ncbi:hypothetical protein NCAS_0A08470 [Naumovozyma castellii]|uniref:GTP-binding protein n=1 Tax=Naumovozyma castellii TaxID=27288 RepID=G0V7F7_NAUCA|nr:hypothetical protein NCAS_0A08470 [Naumovozyma castellii CBS 4309]CCC67405.1 hypothetical protein NCAS_0A08470 [Naumovozyma castellii CBS 4309]
MDYSLSSPPTKTFQRKIAVLGAKNVGKTTLTIRYVESRFLESYYPTVENHFTKLIDFKNQHFTLEIVDTAGQDESSLLNLKSLAGVRGVILCYSVVNRSTFDMIPVVWDKLLDQLERDDIPVIIVGNKIDLRNDLDNRTVVTKQEGKKLANLIRSSDKNIKAGFIECSAKDDTNVGTTFQKLLKQMELLEASHGYQEDNGDDNKCSIM